MSIPPSTDTARSVWREPQVLGLVLLVLAVYFTRIGQPPLRGEESRWSLCAREMLLTGDWIVPHQQGAPHNDRLGIRPIGQHTRPQPRPGATECGRTRLVRQKGLTFCPTPLGRRATSLYEAGHVSKSSRGAADTPVPVTVPSGRPEGRTAGGPRGNPLPGPAMSCPRLQARQGLSPRA